MLYAERVSDTTIQWYNAVPIGDYLMQAADTFTSSIQRPCGLKPSSAGELNTFSQLNDACRVELVTKVREDFTITELRHEKVPIRAFTWLISSDTMDDLWSPRWHSALSAGQDTGESGGVWCDHLVVALLWIILYWILTSQLPNQNYSNTASNWGLNRNCYITASLTTRASNKGSQRFHNNWVGPYTRAFSWLKAPPVLIRR